MKTNFFKKKNFLFNNYNFKTLTKREIELVKILSYDGSKYKYIKLYIFNAITITY